MPTFAQRCARRLPFGWTVEKTGVVANRAAMVVMRPAFGVDGDSIMRHAITLLIALRRVLADTLPARLAFGVIPTRAFDPSTDSVVSALTESELSTSHAWPNNPTATGVAQSPRKWGVSIYASCHAGFQTQRPSLAGLVTLCAAPPAPNVALSQRTANGLSLQLFNGFVLRPPAGTLFSAAILEWGPDASQPHGVRRAGAAALFSIRSAIHCIEPGHGWIGRGKAS
ncbi:hypothetical protein R20233_03480 [Ralstonia sp. LMG 32965]|uniref:hypothetical protein n=1 Tax=Ralstonia flatus TaxID=3058601 RepID=UPI0028F5D953|nr:hypothetical protein [Ralstonia sp. LMG 32965]CAJ0890353.1 hypothetical protein R20233_03480 [Ralstonia sp. LMG 32965]